jgi:hypothetical protein
MIFHHDDCTKTRRLYVGERGEMASSRVLLRLQGLNAEPNATATSTVEGYARSARPRASSLEPRAYRGSRAPYAWRAMALRRVARDAAARRHVHDTRAWMPDFAF